MYCLKIKLVGCDENLVPHIRREILNQRGIVDGEFADVSRAVREVRLNEKDQCLFVMHVRSTEDLPSLKLLSGTFVGRPILALVEAAHDSALVLKAMRAGARQVVMLPLTAEDFCEALDCIAVQYADTASRAKTIAVAGATGGCGNTTIAVNLAYEIALLEQVPCLLVELALRMGVLAAHLDVRPRYTTSDVLVDPDRMDSYVIQQALTPIAENFSILPGPYDSIKPGTISAEGATKLIEFTRHLAEVVVLDVPCTFDDLYFQSLSAADLVVLIVEQKVSSVRGARMVCESLTEHRPYIVVNRYDPGVEGFSADRLRELLHPRDLWTVAADPVVVAAANNGRPLRLQDRRSRALTDVDKLVRELFPKGVQSDRVEPPPTLLGRLGRALSFSHGG